MAYLVLYPQYLVHDTQEVFNRFTQLLNEYDLSL